MNLTPLRQQAERQAAADRSWCLIHPDQALELYTEWMRMYTALALIRQAAEKARVELADHHLEAVRGTLGEIESLATLDKP